MHVLQANYYNGFHGALVIFFKLEKKNPLLSIESTWQHADQVQGLPLKQIW